MWFNLEGVGGEDVVWKEWVGWNNIHTQSKISTNNNKLENHEVTTHTNKQTVFLDYYGKTH